MKPYLTPKQKLEYLAHAIVMSQEEQGYDMVINQSYIIIHIKNIMIWEGMNNSFYKVNHLPASWFKQYFTNKKVGLELLKKEIKVIEKKREKRALCKEDNIKPNRVVKILEDKKHVIRYLIKEETTLQDAYLSNHWKYFVYQNKHYSVYATSDFSEWRRYGTRNYRKEYNRKIILQQLKIKSLNQGYKWIPIHEEPLSGWYGNYIHNFIIKYFGKEHLTILKVQDMI